MNEFTIYTREEQWYISMIKIMLSDVYISLK